jgi:hypothetical protein
MAGNGGQRTLTRRRQARGDCSATPLCWVFGDFRPSSVQAAEPEKADGGSRAAQSARALDRRVKALPGRPAHRLSPPYQPQSVRESSLPKGRTNDSPAEIRRLRLPVFIICSPRHFSHKKSTWDFPCLGVPSARNPLYLENQAVKYRHFAQPISAKYTNRQNSIHKELTFRLICCKLNTSLYFEKKERNIP